MQYLNLRPSQVILDPDNPRLPDGTSSDREAINRLLDEGADALAALARDIVQTGQTNPSELPIAVKHGSRYLILEGNRRFAALKLLKDPDLADDESHRKAFRRVASIGAAPKTVFTLVTDDRDLAEHWIVLRHTGENDGVGVRRWSAGQTATQRRRANKNIDAGTARSIVIADDLEEAYAADQAMLQVVRSVRRAKLTNIGRFFSPDVMTALHLSIEKDPTSAIQASGLYSRHSADDLHAFFAWAMQFVSDNSVDEYKNAAVRAEVLRSIASLIPPLATGHARSRRFADLPYTGGSGPGGTAPPSGGPFGAPTSPSGGGSTGGGGVNSPTNPPPGGNPGPGGSGKGGKAKPEAKLEQFLFQGLKLPNHPARVQNLLKECRTLELEALSGVACVMARVLVELSVSSAAVLKLSGAKEEEPLSTKIKKILKFLDPVIENPRTRDKGLAQAYLETDGLGLQYLNGFVHNPNVQPDVQLARRFSAAFRPLLTRVDGAI